MADIELLIKIDEDTYKARKHWVANPKRMVDEVDIAIANGTPIPDNATNGEVIKAMFEPNINKRHNGEDIGAYYFDEVWWTAPYQKGGK